MERLPYHYDPAQMVINDLEIPSCDRVGGNGAKSGLGWLLTLWPQSSFQVSEGVGPLPSTRCGHNAHDEGTNESWVWWCVPIIPALWRHRQEAC